MTREFIKVVLVLVAVAAPAALSAQDAGVPIEPDRRSMQDRQVFTELERLKDAGRLMDVEQVKAAIKSPPTVLLDLPTPNKDPLSPREIATQARKSVFRIGWYHKSRKSDRWGLNTANAYAIADDGVSVTAAHLVAPDDSGMSAGYLVAIDAANQILPVTGILGFDAKMDAAIVRVEGGQFRPLALNDRMAPGDSVYLFSDPMQVAGYFSAGIVNRFFWQTPGSHDDPNSLAGARDIRMHVSTDWAPGSSGAPVLDACGNAVGHVAEIAPLQKQLRAVVHSAKPASGDDPMAEKDDAAPKETPKKDASSPRSMNLSLPGPTLITLHEAVPARAVRLLAESLAKEPASDAKGE